LKYFIIFLSVLLICCQSQAKRPVIPYTELEERANTVYSELHPDLIGTTEHRNFVQDFINDFIYVSHDIDKTEQNMRRLDARPKSKIRYWPDRYFIETIQLYNKETSIQDTGNRNITYWAIWNITNQRNEDETVDVICHLTLNGDLYFPISFAQWLITNNPNTPRGFTVTFPVAEIIGREFISVEAFYKIVNTF
jgi:hypothetical protein